MKPLNEFLNEGKNDKFNVGDLVWIMPYKGNKRGDRSTIQDSGVVEKVLGRNKYLIKVETKDGDFEEEVTAKFLEPRMTPEETKEFNRKQAEEYHKKPPKAKGTKQTSYDGKEQTFKQLGY